MKVVFKEWKKDPIACAMLIGWFILSTIDSVLNAWVLKLIADCVSYPLNLKYNLTVLISVCIVQILIMSVKSYLRSMMVHHLYTSAYDRYAKKILESDYNMFTVFSCAHVKTVSEFIWRIPKVGIQTVNVINAIIRIIVNLVAIYKIGGKVVLPIILIYIIFTVIMKKMSTVYSKISKKAKKIEKKRNQELENTVNGFSEVRLFNMENSHYKSISNSNNNIYSKFKKRANYDIIISDSFELVDTIGLILAVLISAKLVVVNAIESAMGISLVMYVFRLSEPINIILGAIGDITDAIGMSEDYDKIINFINTQKDGTINLDGFNNEIKINDVSFSYNHSDFVLKNINMVIKKGEHVGICGSSGSGKSTLMKLLNKFYATDSGSITIDGIDIQELTNSSYRRLIGCVQQENHIFPGTIRENILYGVKNVTEYQLMDALHKANLYDFVTSLKEGLETEVGPNGLKLSGGERQRIAIARLFLLNPEIVLLDEATSALDTENEAIVQDALSKFSDKTIITIAHRLSTIKDSDKIYVFGDDHYIIEEGTHEELLSLNGRYAKLYNKK